MKRPAFQFYPADWRKDAALQSCSIAARGLWVEMLCIAHECVPYGHLTINGNAMSAPQIGRLVGLSAKECTALLIELIECGVLSALEDGTYYSRRMVRDEATREKRANGGQDGAEHGQKGAEHGHKGGRPKKETGDKKPPLEPPPSSSSSSSSSEKTPLAPEGEFWFSKFWDEWPGHFRKVARDQCLKKWKKKGCEPIAEQVVAAVVAAKSSDAWAKEGGAFIPAPLVWLNQARWEAPIKLSAKRETIAEYEARKAAEREADRRHGAGAKPPPSLLALVNKVKTA
jgi:hypothetical protein